jgi:hypothetical protein
LDKLMELDHVVMVTPGGYVIGNWELHGPSVYHYLNEDGDAPDEDPVIEQYPGDTWDFFSRGYTGQYGVRRSDPVMHNSEFLGGRLARDILAVDVPTLFVVTLVMGLHPTRSDDYVGWVVLYREL